MPVSIKCKESAQVRTPNSSTGVCAMLLLVLGGGPLRPKAHPSLVWAVEKVAEKVKKLSFLFALLLWGTTWQGHISSRTGSFYWLCLRRWWRESGRGLAGHDVPLWQLMMPGVYIFDAHLCVFSPSLGRWASAPFASVVVGRAYRLYLMSLAFFFRLEYDLKGVRLDGSPSAWFFVFAMAEVGAVAVVLAQETAVIWQYRWKSFSTSLEYPPNTYSVV